MILDTLTGDGYTTRELSMAINKVPYVSRRLAPLFQFKGLTQRNLLLDRKAGIVQIIPTQVWNSGKTTMLDGPSRDAVPFSCVHVPHDGVLHASDISGIRAFGSESELETIEGKQNEILAALRLNHEATHEHMRIGALKGLVVDANGSTTLYDLYDAFGITQTTVDMDLDDSTTDIKAKVEVIRAAIETALGGMPFGNLVAQCSPAFFAALVAHADVEAAYNFDSVSQYFRTNQIAEGTFNHMGVRWERYRTTALTANMTTGEAYVYPEGIEGLFMHYGCPPNWNDTVNTVGLPVYVKSTPVTDTHVDSIKYASESNPAILCSRPEVCIKLFQNQD